MLTDLTGKYKPFALLMWLVWGGKGINYRSYSDLKTVCRVSKATHTF